MIFIISAIRHVITGGLLLLLLLLTLLKLPDELRSQVEAAADWTAPIIGAFIAWFVLKYGAILLRKVGYIQLIMFTTAGLGAFTLSSCSHLGLENEHVETELGYFKKSTPLDEEATFGVLISKPETVVIPTK